MLTGQESECVITYICLVQIKLDARTNSFVQPKPTHTHGTKKVLIVECFIGIVCVQFRSMLWRYVTIIRPMCESKTLCCFFVVIILKLISFSSQSIHCAHINCEERAQLDDASIISSLVKFLSEHVNGVVSVRFYLFSPIVPPK